MSRNTETGPLHPDPATPAAREDTVGPSESSTNASQSGPSAAHGTGSSDPPSESANTCEFDPSATVGDVSGGLASGAGAGAGEDAEVRWIGEFRIEAELGRGAFGVVYRARDTKLDRLVAIKRPLLLDLKSREQYIREARLAAQLDCQGIVPIYYVGTLEDGSPYVVQKLIDGPSLRTLLRQNQRIPAAQATRFVADVARAVAFAHRDGMVHRDLKPDNVLIDSMGRTWVADFGLALQDADQKGRRGEIAGTLPYMAPEQICGRADWLDGRADIWALGIILYELLTGERPFRGGTATELAEEIQHRDPRPIHQRLHDLPPELDAVVRRACSKKPGDRYQTADELADDLEILLDSPALALLPSDHATLPPFHLSGPRTASLASSRSRSARRLESSVPPIAQHAPPQQSRWWTALPLLFAVLLVGGAAVWIGTRRDSWADRAGGEENLRVENPRVQSPGSLAPTAESDEGGRDDLGASRGEDDLGSSYGASTADVSAGETEPRAGSAEGTEREVASEEALAAETPPELTTSSENDPRDVESSTLPPTPRPILVSSAGDGTHRTIGEAIADAVQDEEISIAGGVYYEQLFCDKSVRLRARDPSANVEIVGTTGPALLVSAARVGVEDVALRNAPSAPGVKFNVAEVEAGGTLELTRCRLHAETYNAIKAFQDATVTATECEFRAVSDSAVSCVDTRHLELTECRFVPWQQGIRAPNRAVEVLGSRAEISNCSFEGSHAAGLQCERSAGSRVNVRACQFSDYNDAVIVTSGGQVSMTEGCEIRDCSRGIWVSKSRLAMDSCTITTCDKEAIYAEAGAEAGLRGCEIRECMFGISLLNSKATVGRSDIHSNREAGCQAKGNALLAVTDCTIRLNGKVGIFAEDSTIAVTGGAVSDQLRGIWVDGQNASLRADSAAISAHQEVAVALRGATAVFLGGSIENNTLGIVAEPSAASAAGAAKPDVNAGFRQVRASDLILRANLGAGAVFMDNTSGSFTRCTANHPPNVPACLVFGGADVEVTQSNFQPTAAQNR